MGFRRLIILFLALALITAACGGDDAADPGDEAADATEVAPAADEPAEDTEEETADDEPAEEEATDDAPVEEQVVQIGHLANITGPAASLGVPYTKGIELAVEQINASGYVEGVTFELLTEDTGSDPTNAVTIFNEFAAAGVPVAVSDGISPIALAIGPIANDEEITFITAAGSGSPEDDFEFHLSDIKTQYDEIGPYLVEEGGPRVAAILGTDNPAFPLLTDNMQAGVEAGGGEMVHRETFEPGTTDFSAALTNVSAADPDVVFVVALADTAGNIVAQMEQVGGFDDVLVSIQSGINRTVFDVAGSAAENVVFRPAFAAGVPGSEAFVEAYAEANDGELPDTNSAFGHDTAWIIATAVRMTLEDGEEITGEAIRARVPDASVSDEVAGNGVIPDMVLEASGVTTWPGVLSTFNSDGDIVALEG